MDKGMHKIEHALHLTIGTAEKYNECVTNDVHFLYLIFMFVSELFVIGPSDARSVVSSLLMATIIFDINDQKLNVRKMKAVGKI